MHSLKELKVFKKRFGDFSVKIILLVPFLFSPFFTFIRRLYLQSLIRPFNLACKTGKRPDRQRKNEAQIHLYHLLAIDLLSSLEEKMKRLVKW